MPYSAVMNKKTNCAEVSLVFSHFYCLDLYTDTRCANAVSKSVRWWKSMYGWTQIFTTKIPYIIRKMNITTTNSAWLHMKLDLLLCYALYLYALQLHHWIHNNFLLCAVAGATLFPPINIYAIRYLILFYMFYVYSDLANNILFICSVRSERNSNDKSPFSSVFSSSPK